MARLVISNSIHSGGVFIPGQLFAFGSIILHADPTGHLGWVDGFAPDQEIRFGNLKFCTDSWGDLVLAGFSAPPEGPANPEALTSNSAYPAIGLAATPDPALSSDSISTLDGLGSPSAEHDFGAISNAPGAATLQIDHGHCQNMDPIKRDTRSDPSHGDYRRPVLGL
jgi:hypothetical protein